MMKIVRMAELVEVPWKNGGGVTREIAESRDRETLAWRLSMADVASDGPFSDFTGLMRILTVIDGTGLELVTPDGVLRADLAAPIRFDGGLRVVGRLTQGPIRDLNLMFEPVRIEGDIVPIVGPVLRMLRPEIGTTFALHCLAGTVDLSPAGHLRRGDTALIDAGSVDVDLAGGASALLVTLHRRDQTEASSAATAPR